MALLTALRKEIDFMLILAQEVLQVEQDTVLLTQTTSLVVRNN